MNLKPILPIILTSAVLLPTGANALSGSAKLACEMILCLSAGSRPSECSNPIKAFFDIRKRKPTDTIKARGNFLNLCPAVGMGGSSMRSLTAAIARGAGSCSASDLNIFLSVEDSESGDNYISSTYPAFCKIYHEHEYTIVDRPRYVGKEGRRGRWVHSSKYASAQAAWLAEEKRIKQASDSEGD